MNEHNNSSATFMHGAIILLIANIVVKLIGAIFKIPLTYILGEEGMGYFSTAYQVYTWMFIVATAGIPVAISKMISESYAKNRPNEIKNIFSVSTNLLITIGISGFLLLYLGADFFAGTVLKNPGAAYGIKAIAPAMLFVSLMSAYRGYFQGHQNMVPTALSEIFEALGKLIIGFGAAYILIEKGMELSSAGAVFGVSCGGLMGFVVLFLIYKKEKSKPVRLNGIDRGSETKSRILKNLVKIAVPITIGASVFSLTSLIDTAMIMRRLQVLGAFTHEEANKLWGSYSGYAIPLFNLPPTLINAITVSIVPAIASAYAVKDFKTASHTTSKSLKITVLFALPCAVGMSMLSKPILALVYNNINATSTLSILSVAIVFVSLVLVTNAILQATGNEMIPVMNMLIGGTAKILINFFLVANPKININGAPIGTTTCYGIILVLNIIAITRKLKLKLPISELIVKPGISALAMGIVLYFAAPLCLSLGRIMAATLPIVIGAITYAIMIVAVKGINEEDIALLPKAELLTKICKKLKVIR
ncbi:MAG: polysaccharide biosynthesis protein [Clostridia bacterium]|nr:polysaccharide biosynthesis protein [Clostridia bacterium]